MPYRLGLDVGTASCGLIAWHLDAHGQPSSLACDSLDIWSEPLQPAKSGGVGQPKKAARRAARQLRRGISRRARRLRKIAYIGALLRIDLATISPDTGQHIHHLRARAAEEKIGLDDLLRVLLHLAKNRGPSGDWVYVQAQESVKNKTKRGKRAAVTYELDSGGELTEAGNKATEEKKGIVGGVRRLEGLMQEAAKTLGKGDLTLGQYLYYRQIHGESVILGRPEVGLYPSRRMVESEFHRIWDRQVQFYPVLADAEICRKLFNAIFYQRPLKSPAPMVGHCPLEPTLPRAPAAQMAAQVFRIEKQLADLRWGIGRHAEPMSQEQKQVIRALLDTKGETAFSVIVDELKNAGCPSPAGRGLNMDRSGRESLKGNTTLATFRKFGLEGEWNALSEKTQVQAINFLADLGSPDALDGDDWHLNFVTTQKDAVSGQMKRREFDPALVNFINFLRKHPNFGRLSTMGFDGGRMAYSIKALRKLNDLMRQGMDERAAIERAYPERFEPRQLEHELPLPPETGNTVVDVALRQVYRAVHRAMNALGGPPAQVIVELSRDMALGVKKRGEIETRINVNNKRRRDARKAIVEHGEPATDRNIDRYLLWEQQLHYCPYCDRRIELGEALGSETEREHILPRTLTRVGGKRSQLVLAHKTCNQEKGNRTPWQAFGSDAERWRTIEERATQLQKNRQRGKARLLLLKDWEGEVLDDEAITGFTDRQFHETSWISKLAAQWLRAVCADVSVSRGELTAHLRRIWKLDTVIPQVRYASKLPVLDREEKPISMEEFQRCRLWWEGHDQSAGAVPTDRKPDKRIDHRHHLVDALVISLTDRKLFRRMAENYKRERERERAGERARLRLYEAPPRQDLRELALETVAKVTIRHKTDHFPDGPLFKQSAYGLSRKPSAKGKRLLAMSKPLKALIDNKGSVEATRRVLESIESEVTRLAVLQAFDQRIASGVDLKQVFNEAIPHPQFVTRIGRVRLLGDSADTAATIVHRNRQGQALEKHYRHANNAYMEILVQDGKLIGAPRLVTVQQAMKEKGSKPPPGVRRFWKGDIVRLADGTLHLVGVLASDGGGQLRLVPVTETCAFGELKKRGLATRTVKGRNLAQVTVVDV